MQISQESLFNITLINEEIPVFIRLMSKVNDYINKSRKIGFKKEFDQDEISLITGIIENINNKGDEAEDK